MRIDDTNRAPATQAAEKTDQASQKRGLEKDTASTSGADKADVSQLAKALTASSPERLEQLRQAVQSGNYEVPADVIAGAIIGFHSSE